MLPWVRGLSRTAATSSTAGFGRRALGLAAKATAGTLVLGAGALATACYLDEGVARTCRLAYNLAPMVVDYQVMLVRLAWRARETIPDRRGPVPHL